MGAGEQSDRPVLPDPAALPKGQRERRRRIIDAASELLVAHDFERIQIRDVAERSGVALGTVYRYFGSKEHLYAAVLLDWSESDPIKHGAAPDPGLPPAERMRIRLHHSVERFEQYPTFLRLQNVLRQSTDPIVRALFAEFSARVLASFRDHLPDLPADDAADIVAIVTAVLAHELILFGLGRQDVAEVHRLLDRTVDLVFAQRVQA
ncbi:TetR/AcrR family transcriptional regulator [Rhodococcus sp. SGAir0479]|uniref:TetR/AcrR family transcriptional regulator n=1 Tax=Rhodococcus sp. SGAir0479 TaxID=2567884 RepID=UPI0010CD3B96|nr:TetR/AcrR family transcriptional regulator [Rhodococcus sp. SGAir0479]QCQ92746.1 TetR/AcrR family transcriptional regulator [Rhodococcus sp. SGAir0479]